MNRRITSSPWGFRFYTFDKYCQFMSNLEIKDISVTLGIDPELPLLIPENSSAEEFDQVSSTVQGYGLKIIEAGGGGDYSREDTLEQEVQKTKQQIGAAAGLRAEYFRVCISTAKIITDGLIEIGREAQKQNMILLLENHGGATTTGIALRKLIEEIGLSNVRANYDPANFFYFGEDPLEALREIKPYVSFCHLKNCRFKGGKPEYCRLEEGEINYREILQELLPTYSGYLGLEYEEPSDAEEGTKDDFVYLKALLKELDSNP